jgi:hypothetical protein
MVDNLRFIDHEHFCRVCEKDIDMYRVKEIILAEMRYNDYYGTHTAIGIKRTDPFIVKDHGNDVELVCSFDCYKKFLNVD